jgi:hypothetical protein
MDFHIFTTNNQGRDDQSPLQLISAELLAHYRRIESEYVKLQRAACMRRRRGSDNTRTISPKPAP